MTKRWVTDAQLADERDFQHALEILNTRVGLYWDTDEDPSLRKHPLEIEAFLQFLIDDGRKYQELTPKEQNFLQKVRRMHCKFWGEFDRIMREYDEEKAMLDKHGL